MAPIFPTMLFLALIGLSLASPSKDFDDLEEQNFFRVVGQNKTENATPKKCKPLADCESDLDCGGTPGKKGTPRCVGTMLDRCNCAACLSVIECKNDAKCGGLVSSCNTTKNQCNCLEAANNMYKATPGNFPTLAAAIGYFCTKQSCKKEGCFGLPCHKGKCFCK